MHNEKYLKVKKKTYNGKIDTNFHNNKIPKEWFQCMCLSIILVDSLFRTGNNYYPLCKYVVKVKKCQSMLLTAKNSDEKNSDEENSNERNLKYSYSKDNF